MDKNAVSEFRPRAVASLERGSTTRATIMATTRSRSGELRDAMRCSSPILRNVPSTAATWPWGRLRTISNLVSPALGKVSPLRTRPKASILGAGQSERLARVRYAGTLAEGFAQEDGRGRMAVGDHIQVHDYYISHTRQLSRYKM